MEKGADFFRAWADQYLNFEKTPVKNIFWLKTMEYICEKLGNPQDSYKKVHVAGSKGKGSVSVMTANILKEAGYKTGLYSSPHILNFNERITMCGEPFSDSLYEKSAREIMEVLEKLSINDFPEQRNVTWFELVTAYAFKCFKDASCDYGVFEVGLGGRLDATNVIVPEVCGITAIEKEHVEFLGDTVEKIAAEKGGIIKEGVPVYIAKQQTNVRKVFEEIARERNTTVSFIDDLYTIGSESYDFIDVQTIGSLENSIPRMKATAVSSLFSRPLNFNMRLMGSFQCQNAALAASLAKNILPDITEDIIEKGINESCLPGRFEVENVNNHVVVLDGAHTPQSVKFTMETFNHVFGNAKTVLLFACAEDKDVKSISEQFKNRFEKIYITIPGTVKKADYGKALKAFEENGMKNTIHSEDYEAIIEDAVKYAAENNAVLLVTGSFYLVSEVKKILK